MGGGRVARLPGVDDGDPASGPGEDERGGQAGGAAADDHYVVFVHVHEVRAWPRRAATVVAVSGKPRCNDLRDDGRQRVRSRSATRRVGRRRRARPRGPAAAARCATSAALTLTEVAEQTGISKSTLSRLETGQRRPSLELLLPLAQAYRVPIDDLVGAPEVGDPRVRLKPRQVNGRTVLPLTQPGGIQAWKIVIPASAATPEPASP